MRGATPESISGSYIDMAHAPSSAQRVKLSGGISGSSLSEK